MDAVVRGNRFETVVAVPAGDTVRLRLDRFAAGLTDELVVLSPANARLLAETLLRAAERAEVVPLRLTDYRRTA